MHHRVLFLCIVASCALGCGSTGDTEKGASSGGGQREITGAGGADWGSTSTGLPKGRGSGGAGGEGGAAPAVGPFPVVLAHGFFGFEDFAGLDFVTYFYEVQEKLAAEGITVYTPAVDPFNDSDTRGAELLVAIKQILQETGAAKVDIVGHSQGGLDARVVANLRPDLVAAIVTVGTPHDGTPVADVVTQLVSDPNAQGAIDEIVNLIGEPLYDMQGNDSSVFKPLELFSQPGIKAFNAAHPDEPSVFYASIAGRSALHPKDGDCATTANLSFISMYDDTLDPIDPGLALTELICDGGQGYANDGLIRVKDAKRGEFWGCVPADHLDEIGQLFGDSPGLGNDFDYIAFYTGIVGELRNRGF